MADAPSKTDIQLIFKRLRSIPTNKQCFDCGSNNPTWASISYGVFLCIDCSAVHRSLGVHVSFIRSTQLDTNWTWLQLRAMQVGGNANAIGFFRQHGCTSKDAQQKYHSRAATMYKDKLHALASHAMRLHGTKAIIDGHNDPSSPDAKEVDFFAEHHDQQLETGTEEAIPMSEGQRLVSDPVPIQNGKPSAKQEEKTVDTGEGPSVEAALSMSPTVAQAQAEPRKSLIGAKKPAARKGKGAFGAQKVKTNFTEVENRAQQIDKDKENMAANIAQQEAKTREEQEQQMASMRLAYQDMDLERKKQEEKLKQTDPKKAKQMERLGMGFSGSRGISHSAVSDMTTIEQEGTSASRFDMDKYERQSRNKNSFFEEELDSYSGFSSGPPKYDSPFGGTEKSSNDDSGGWGNSNKSGGWGMDRFESKQESHSESITSKEDDRPTRTRKSYDSTPTSDDAVKKFGNAKSISSDQFFGNKDADFETKASLSKFEGSTGISSADLFGGGETHRSTSYKNNAPDLQDIKDGVRQGVTKVAGKLSTLANGMMSSLQDM